MSLKEIKAAQFDDLKNGEMKNVSVGNGKELLLCRIENNYYAVSANCTHYGAPLSDGILNGEKIVCPWHHACFNAKTGTLLEPPAMDPLIKFDVIIKNEDVVILIPDNAEESKPAVNIKTTAKSESGTYVILGGGAAGNSAALSLRNDGFDGKIFLISKENKIPYDRPNLSKEYLSGEAEEEWMPLRNEEFYNDNDIELLLNHHVTELNVPLKEIKFTGNKKIKFDKVLIATGGKAKRLNLPGENLNDIFTLRNFRDADNIIEASHNAERVIIIGASFIGLETAFSLSKRKIPVTIISQELIPFERVFGREVGKLFRNLHEENGVTFRLSRTLKSFEGKEKVEAVTLEQGGRIETDLVIMGVGVEPSTEFIKGLNLQKDGSVRVNKYFQAENDIYAAGDIITMKDWRTNEDIRIEHWRTALQQGRLAAHNMKGIAAPFNCIPFFWTEQLGISLRYVGHAKDWEEIIIHGDIASKDFISYYIKNNMVYSAAGCNRDKEMAAIEELMISNKMPPASKLKYDSVDFIGLLSK